MNIECEECGASIRRKPYKVRINKHNFCSQECKTVWQKFNLFGANNSFFGKHFPETAKKTLSAIHKGKHYSLNTEFKKHHKEKKEWIEKRRKTIEKNHSLSGQKNPMFGRSGKLNPNWKGGISYWRKEFYNSIPYKEWQKSVFGRDNYKCRICKRTKERGRILHAHHIKEFADYPKLRLEIDNGLTLCNKCHNIVHSNNNPFNIQYGSKII
jgi:hypothetical protein